MLEISSTALNKGDKKIKPRKKADASRTGAVSFKDSLDASISIDFQGTLDELIDDLGEYERQFLDNQSIYELNRYKAAVKKILQMILDGGFKTKTLRRLNRDKSDFTIISEIDAKLLEISRNITGSNNKAFNLLKQIEQIRGLLLDLTH